MRSPRDITINQGRNHYADRLPGDEVDEWEQDDNGDDTKLFHSNDPLELLRSHAKLTNDDINL